VAGKKPAAWDVYLIGAEEAFGCKGTDLAWYNICPTSGLIVRIGSVGVVLAPENVFLRGVGARKILGAPLFDTRNRTRWPTVRGAFQGLSDAVGL
jgi:hypothetical protein